MILVYSTFSSKKEARQIGEQLVRKKLAACCNIFETESIYSWKGKIEKKKEFAAFLKTKGSNFKKVEKYILAKHSYDTPCVMEVPLGRIAKNYLSWLKNAS